MSQCNIILNALKNGPVTAAKAIDRFAIYRLAARINDLRRRGHDIKTIVRKAPTINGKHTRFAEYHFIAKEILCTNIC